MSVAGFEIDDVEYIQAKKAWSVECRFWQGFGLNPKIPYRVLISEDGRILDAKKMRRP